MLITNPSSLGSYCLLISRVHFYCKGHRCSAAFHCPWSFAMIIITWDLSLSFTVLTEICKKNARLWELGPNTCPGGADLLLQFSVFTSWRPFPCWPWNFQGPWQKGNCGFVHIEFQCFKGMNSGDRWSTPLHISTQGYKTVYQLSWWSSCYMDVTQFKKQKSTKWKVCSALHNAEEKPQ